MTDEKKKEYTMRITSANKSALVVILYEMYLDYLDEAIESVDDSSKFRDAIRKSKGCLSELMDSLNFDYELSYQFLQLYTYVNREMVRANIKRKAKPLENCRMVMGKLYEAYKTASVCDKSLPVMENAQEVYVGMTYGRSSANEMVNIEKNRGFLV